MREKERVSKTRGGLPFCLEGKKKSIPRVPRRRIARARLLSISGDGREIAGSGPNEALDSRIQRLTLSRAIVSTRGSTSCSSREISGGLGWIARRPDGRGGRNRCFPSTNQINSIPEVAEYCWVPMGGEIKNKKIQPRARSVRCALALYSGPSWLRFVSKIW